MTGHDITAAVNRAVGKRLLHAMTTRGISRASLAADLGITETRLARIIKGSSEMTVPELIFAARSIGCPPSALIIA